jgi:hypothetical protein
VRALTSCLCVSCSGVAVCAQVGPIDPTKPSVTVLHRQPDAMFLGKDGQPTNIVPVPSRQAAPGAGAGAGDFSGEAESAFPVSR